MNGATILIVEDEEKLASLLADFLHQAGFQTAWLDDGRKVTDYVRATPPAAVLLDLMLPGLDGLEVCRALRAFSEVPILMTTARVDEIDRLLGLELGADDYICKPYSPREVVARVRAVLRRRLPDRPELPLRFEDDKLRASLHSVPLELTAIEYQLLRLMAAEPGRIFSRDALMQRIYPDRRVVADRTIDSHVKKLRRKLEMAEPEREYVHSVYGVGYKFET
ncbi:response regulator [Chitinimonas lacunae]|uniref:Response regulator n=1 Tax=Chitinimonas lacunae TaxID=1963018 RepID=A0ABV8MSP5_9NEIS